MSTVRIEILSYITRGYGFDSISAGGKGANFLDR